MHSVNTRLTGSHPDRFLRLLIGQPHVQEALAAQGVQQEAILGHGQQDGHGVGELGLDPQAEDQVLHVLAIDRVHGRVAGAELGGEVFQRARATALADREHVLPGEVAPGRLRIEAFRDELDPVPLVVRDGQQLIFDVRDPDVARPEILDRVRALGPHLGVGARDEQALLDVGRELQVLTALDGHDLLTAHVTLLRGLPYDPPAVLYPAAVVDLDRGARPHQVVEQQGKAQADRPAPGDGDVQDGRGASRTAAAVGPCFEHLEAESHAADHELVAGPQRLGGHLSAVDPGAVAAPAVGQDVAAGLGPQLGMGARGEQAGEDDVVPVVTTECQRLAADRKAPAHEGTVKPDNCGYHRIGLRSRFSTGRADPPP